MTKKRPVLNFSASETDGGAFADLQPTGRSEGELAVTVNAPPPAMDMATRKALAPAKAPAAWPVYLPAALIAAVCGLAPAAYVLGYQGGLGPLMDDRFLLAVVALLTILPAALVLLSAYLVQQGRRLAAEAEATRRMAKTMLAPAALAAAEAGGAVEMLRNQIMEASDAAQIARDRLMALREGLMDETSRLVQATEMSVRAAGQLSEQLGRERGEFISLAENLDRQSSAVTDAIGRQAKMVTEASDLAEVQLREAEAALAARAADLAAAAGEATDTARVVSDDLERQVVRLETAGAGVSDQMRLTAETLGGQRAGLVAAAHALRADQEDFAVQLETRGAQISEFIVQAKLGASEVGDKAAKSAEALDEMISLASERVGEFAETTRRERESLTVDADRQLAAVSRSLSAQRVRVEEELDGLSNAAQAAFQARLADARDLVEGSANAIEQAGAAAVQHLDRGVTQARGALVDLQRLLADIDERSARVPQEAKASAAEVRGAIEAGIDELLAQARRAAEETKAIDAAFNERVKRNYEMLSEAVKLMGGLSDASRLDRARAEPRTPPSDPAAAGLRGRLRLTPAPSDDPLNGLTEPGPPPKPLAAEDLGRLRWDELMTEAPADEGSAPADEVLIVEVRGMGIDPGALLPKGKVEEIAGALQRGDRAAGREVVRKLAPAAIRRLVRRLFSDDVLKTRSERFVARYGEVVANAARGDGAVVVIASLLTSEAGRTYLLLDAATGELA